MDFNFDFLHPTPITSCQEEGGEDIMQRSISFLPNTGRESTLEKKYDLDFQYHFCKIGTEHHTYTPIWTNDHKWKGYIYIYTYTTRNLVFSNNNLSLLIVYKSSLKVISDDTSLPICPCKKMDILAH
jgi:hypothetical protein